MKTMDWMNLPYGVTPLVKAAIESGKGEVEISRKAGRDIIWYDTRKYKRASLIPGLYLQGVDETPTVEDFVSPK